MARKRQDHEESIVNQAQQNIQRIRQRDVSVTSSCIAEADETSEHEQSVDSRRGMQMAAQMNSELETLIRSVY